MLAPQTQLTQRDRYRRFARYQDLDRLPFWSDWLSVNALQRWHREGLPEHVRTREDALAHFGFEGVVSIFWGSPRVPVKIQMHPPFPVEVLEETAAYRVSRRGGGDVVKQFKDTRGAMPTFQWLAYPIRTRDDWRRFRDERLDPAAPGRYPDEAEWATLKRMWRDREHTITIDGGSFYGFLRNWMGVEDVSLLFFDDPELVHEMVDYLAAFYMEVLHRALHEVEVDFACFWEDMCYKTGPLISPAMFREFVLPGYKKVTAFLAEHGVDSCWVDCDGNIEQLIPLWIEGGVRGFYPLEVAADMDAAKLRAEYGREILLWGNVDKRALAQGRGAIDAELARLAPVVAQGGFIPLVDHGVPEDVSFADYLYYLEQRKRLTGCA